MEEKRVKEIERKLQVFSLDGLQNLITLFDVLQREGISVEDVKGFIEFRIKAREFKEVAFRKRAELMKEVWNKNTRRCPTCMKPLVARSINTPKGKANREGYTCQWYCQEDSCGFEEYTHESYQEIYKKIMGGR